MNGVTEFSLKVIFRPSPSVSRCVTHCLDLKMSNSGNVSEFLEASASLQVRRANIETPLFVNSPVYVFFCPEKQVIRLIFSLLFCHLMDGGKDRHLREVWEGDGALSCF